MLVVRGKIRLCRYIIDYKEKQYGNRSWSGNDKTSSLKIISWCCLCVNPCTVMPPSYIKSLTKGHGMFNTKYILYSTTNRLFKTTGIFHRRVSKTQSWNESDTWTEWMTEEMKQRFWRWEREEMERNSRFAQDNLPTIRLALQSKSP